MNLAQIILRNCSNSPKPRIFSPASFACSKYCQKSSQKGDSSSSSSSSESDDDKKKPSQTDASTQLNMLLQEMLQDNATKSKNDLKLAKPLDQRALKKKEKEDSVTVEPIEKQVIKAVGEVAEALGGNKTQTESELLIKLLNPVDSSNATNSLSDILKGMKIDRESKPPQSRAEQVRSVLQRFKPSQQSQERPRERQRPKRMNMTSHDLIAEKVDLWSAQALGIFTDEIPNLKESPQNKTWQKLYQKELKLAVTHPPANYFQEMILWTEQGKLWQFPINNEFGLEEESNVYFADHVFLEEHLEPWCPRKGPIRRFMELVCVGLSKNSYLTVAAKKEHIEWYKNYFEDKKKVLQDVGALQVDDVQQKSIDKE